MTKELLKAKKRVKKPHILYLVVLEHPTTKESFIKIGITAYKLEMRFIDCDYKVKYSKEYPYPDGILARGWESLLKEQILPYDWKCYPQQKDFAGKTQCYELKKLREVEAMMDEVLIAKKRGRKKKEIIVENKPEPIPVDEFQQEEEKDIDLMTKEELRKKYNSL